MMTGQGEQEQWCRLLGVAPDATPAKVCERFERVAIPAITLPDCITTIYCVATSTLPKRFQPECETLGGWCDRFAYATVREYLPQDRGPGLVLFVRDAESEDHITRALATAHVVLAAMGDNVTLAELRQLYDADARLDSVLHIAHVLTHEMGHAVCTLADADYAADMELLSFATSRPMCAAALTRRFTANERFHSQQSPPPPQIASHGLQFTRAMAHICYRLRAMNVHATPDDTAGERYNQRSYAECRAALGEEPYRCLRKSFRDILARPMPATFAACQLANTGQRPGRFNTR